VRVNSLGTQWCHGDFVAVVSKGVDGIVLPKVESASDLKTADRLLKSLERERGLPEGGIDLIPIIETALGFSNIGSIARAGTRARLDHERRAVRQQFGLVGRPGQSHVEREIAGPERQAPRAAGLEPPIDTVWVALKDSDGFRRSVQRAKDLGFQGKMCIHPDQVPVVNDCFCPGQAELAHARRVIEGFAEAERKGLAAIQVDGQFVDYPIVYLAQRLIARAQAIEEAGQRR
jgi:citrate lyase subunit beta/citryl-CoA lyase